MKYNYLKTATILLLLVLLFNTSLYSQVYLSADGPGKTYELVSKVLGGAPYEVPDCKHTSFGSHITEEWDSQLGKYVFVFHIHVNEDDDRCSAFDRQRNEIKTYGPSPDNVKGTKGEIHTYQWKFKLDPGFKPSPNFTHIHQIKAGDGSDAGAPIITITPRSKTPEALEIIHTPSGGGGGVVKSTELAPFKGTWVEVYEKVKYTDNGSYEILIKRVNDGAVLLSYSNNNIDLWRGDATYNRPKWGIYRSLNSTSYLRDEKVRFADFCIAEGNAVCRIPTGMLLNDHASEAIEVYPNPTEKTSFLRLHPDIISVAEVTVINSLGAEVYRSTLSAGQQKSIDLTGMDAGIYIIRLIANDRVWHKKLVKI
jgi:hypothetical protein